MLMQFRTILRNYTIYCFFWTFLSKSSCIRLTLCQGAWGVNVSRQQASAVCVISSNAATRHQGSQTDCVRVECGHVKNHNTGNTCFQPELHSRGLTLNKIYTYQCVFMKALELDFWMAWVISAANCPNQYKLIAADCNVNGGDRTFTTLFGWPVFRYGWWGGWWPLDCRKYL